MIQTIRLRQAATAAAAMACTVAAAQSSVTIFGRLNTGVEHARLAGTGVSRLSNYRSVLGFRGTEDLGGGLRAIWQIEGAVALDTGAAGLANRNTHVGFAGPWGTLAAGVWAQPYTTATAAFDPFYTTTAGYMALMGNGSAPISGHVQDTSSFDRRQTNQLQYASPKWQGWSSSVSYGFKDETAASGSARPWLASGAVRYETDALVLTAAHERHRAYQTADTTDTASKLGAAYTFGPARLAAVVEHLRYGTATGRLSRNAWYVSASYQIGAGALKAGYARAGDGRGPSTDTVGFFRSGAGTGAQQFTVGYEHALSRRTALHAFYSRIRNEPQAVYDFAINELGVRAGQQPSVFALGLRHNF